jgi:O-acetyl-ADP-ribose deacetylase (regulator of RNase III)
LSARHVIHAVGPIYRSQDESAPLLTSAYRSALALANTHSFDSLAFVAISCGIFGYPLDAAAELALDAVASGVGQLRDVRFVFLDANAHDAWLAAATKRFGED